MLITFVLIVSFSYIIKWLNVLHIFHFLCDVSLFVVDSCLCRFILMFISIQNITLVLGLIDLAQLVEKIVYDTSRKTIYHLLGKEIQGPRAEA